MLIAFHSSPYSAPLQTGTPNRGFELDVDILFADSDSHDYIHATKCEFHINASSPGKQKPLTFYYRFFGVFFSLFFYFTFYVQRIDEFLLLLVF